jgi:hypothetical protein
MAMAIGIQHTMLGENSIAESKYVTGIRIRKGVSRVARHQGNLWKPEAEPQVLGKKLEMNKMG